MKTDLTLKRLENTGFPQIYKEFITNNCSALINYQSVLSIAIVLINSKDIYIKKLGYRIIVHFCNQTNNYIPLYEISINLGLFPIAKSISSAEQYQEFSFTLNSQLNSAFLENYLKKNKYQSYSQRKLDSFFLNYMNSSITIIAPTSYGKTDLILALVERCENNNICIITPTKSLLAQTKARIANAKFPWVKKIITHPEMYNKNDTHMLAVLTQERLLRLLRKDSKLSFDYIVIDEAHTLLNKEERSTLLASVILLLEKRNRNSVFKFLTPFLKDKENLAIKYSKIVNTAFFVNEYMKTENFYLLNKDMKFEFYDHFLNQFYSLGTVENSSIFSFIENNSKQKNIVYLNKPVDIEDFASTFADKLTPPNSLAIDRACHDIAKYISPKYNLVKALKSGIIYHHGSVPEPIRLYIEYLYTTVAEIKYVITSSTLLEGVNLPAERMFLLDNKKGIKFLSFSDFNNLVGRVCRFGDIFTGSLIDLKKLEPNIYIIQSSYCNSKINLHNFLRDVCKIDKNFKEVPENVLLENTKINSSNDEKRKTALEFIENYENFTIKDYNLNYATTEIGKSCFLNNISEIPIIQSEIAMQAIVENFRETQNLINNSLMVMNIIDKIFLSHIGKEEQSFSYQNIARLRNQAAKNYYSMFLNWRIRGSAYSEMINSTLSYWNKLDYLDDSEDILVFVGKWGDCTRGNGHRKYWTDIRTKNDIQRINLAIVRIKEEQDFLENIIIKYIEVLNDLGLMEETFYNRIKYGTSDEVKISLIRNGFSLSLSNLLVDHYMKYLLVNTVEDIVNLKEGLIDSMTNNEENQILVNEVRYYILN